MKQSKVVFLLIWGLAVTLDRAVTLECMNKSKDPGVVMSLVHSGTESRPHACEGEEGDGERKLEQRVERGSREDMGVLKTRVKSLNFSVHVECGPSQGRVRKAGLGCLPVC